MRFAKFAKGSQSIFCAASLIATAFATSVVTFDALANPQTPSSVAVDYYASQWEVSGQDASCSSADIETCQSDEYLAVSRITQQNIHSIKNRDVYGSELMTKSELAKFREDLKQCDTPDQLESFLESHRIRMKARAAERGVVLN